VRTEVVDLPSSMTESDQNWSGTTDRCETMTIVAPWPMRKQIFVHRRLALRVERAGGLVEDQNARIVDQRARDRETLALSAERFGEPLRYRFRNRSAALDEFLGAREPRRADGSANVSPGRPAIMFVPHRAANRKLLCNTTPETLTQMPKVYVAQVRSVDLHETAVVAVKPLQETRNRGLAGSAAPHDSKHGAGGTEKLARSSAGTLLPP